MTYVKESSNTGCNGSLFKIGTLKNQSRGFTAKFHQDRLEVLARERSNDTANSSAAREVDLTNGRMGDQLVRHLRGIFRTMEQHVDHTSGQASLAVDISQEPIALGAGFGTLQDTGVTSGDGVCDGADTKDKGCVPGKVSIGL